MPDISETLAPKSEQLDNIDLRGGGPRIFTITQVDVHFGSDQPIVIHLAEFPRPWKPGKNMRRALAECWGRESDDWVGRQVELYADEKVKFGNDTPGGTRISRASHIDGPKSAAILQGQGKPGLWKVLPLPDAPAASAPTTRPVGPKPETLQRLAARFGDINLDGDARPAYIADVIGHPVNGYGDLTEDDAQKVIAAIEADLDQPFPTKGGE